MTLLPKHIIAFDKAFDKAVLNEENWNDTGINWSFVDADVTCDLVDEFNFDINLVKIQDEFNSSASEINSYMHDMNITSFAQYKELN
jgi:hypothetical protein